MKRRGAGFTDHHIAVVALSALVLSGCMGVGVIRASDMRFVQHDAEWGNFDVYSIAQDLASE